MSLAELKTFGRRLGDAQGRSDDESVDWTAYGAAARDALRRGNGVPLLADFMRATATTTPHLRTLASKPLRQQECPQTAPERRRFGSRAWCLRVICGASWRLMVFGVVSAVAAAPSISALCILAAVGLIAIVASMSWRRCRQLSRWLVAGASVAFVLPATDWYRLGVAVTLVIAPLASMLAARRWRLSA